MIRPFRNEVARYGEYSKAGEFVYDFPHLWGSKRTGPDVHRVGGKYPDSWHWEHMYDPNLTSYGSIMPPYPWLFDDDLDVSYLPKKIRVMQTLGVPYDDGYDEIALDDLKKQAADIARGLRDEGYDADESKEIIALIAYLQRLGTDIQVAEN